VLAVGDAQFQAKCLGKMEDVTREGRTVIFVSHNLAAVRNLCPRSLVLEQGRLVFDGATDDAIERYLSAEVEQDVGIVEGERLAQRLAKTRVYAHEPSFVCHRISLLDENGSPRTAFRSDEEITVAVDWECLKPVPSFRILVVVSDRHELPLVRTESIDDPSSTAMLPLQPGRYRSVCRLPRDLFGEERLRLNVSLITEVVQILDYLNVIDFSVTFQGYNGNMRSRAFLRPRVPWATELLAGEPASVSG